MIFIINLQSLLTIMYRFIDYYFDISLKIQLNFLHFSFAKNPLNTTSIIMFNLWVTNSINSQIFIIHFQSILSIIYW